MYHPENVGEPRKDIHLTNIAMNIYLNTPDVGCLVWHGTFLKESFWNSFTNKFSRNQHLPENCKFVCVSVCSTFLVIIAKERLLSTFFCVESLFLKCLFWTLCFFEWKQPTWKTGFPQKRRHSDVAGGRDLFQKLRCCPTDPRMSSLTRSVRELWSFIPRSWLSWAWKVCCSKIILHYWLDFTFRNFSSLIDLPLSYSSLL